jgi:hypothetical protein
MKRFFLFGYLALVFLPTYCLAQNAGSVVFASGAAVIVAKDGRSREAVRGAEFSSGEMIDTADGRVQLRFLDGASMSLQPATRFRIDDFRFVVQDGKASGDDQGIFSLVKGGFRTITGLIGKQRREQYRVDTAVATIGIRGTDYSAQLSEAGLSVSTFGGLVEVCSGAGCLQIGPGETVVVPSRDGRPMLQGQLESVLDGVVVPGLSSSPVPSPEVVAPAAIPARQMPSTYNY